MARGACDGCGNAIEQCDCEPVETVITAVCRQCARVLIPASPPRYFCTYECGWKWANAALDSKASAE